MGKIVRVLAIVICALSLFACSVGEQDNNNHSSESYTSVEVPIQDDASSVSKDMVDISELLEHSIFLTESIITSINNTEISGPSDLSVRELNSFIFSCHRLQNEKNYKYNDLIRETKETSYFSVNIMNTMMHEVFGINEWKMDDFPLITETNEYDIFLGFGYGGGYVAENLEAMVTDDKANIQVQFDIHHAMGEDLGLVGTYKIVYNILDLDTEKSLRFVTMEQI